MADASHEPQPQPPAPPPPSRDPRVPTAVLALIAILVVAGAFVAGRMRPFEPTLPPISTSVVDIHPTPNVILEIRDLSRLETASYHMERVIEAADEQSHLFGLLRSKDALMLVAVGEVVAGVDFAKVSDADVAVDWPKKSVRVHLPTPEIFTVAIDNARTHVVTRTTDTLATRREDLEGTARADAETSMRQAAVDAGILDRARTSAERSVRALLQALGFESITID